MKFESVFVAGLVVGLVIALVVLAAFNIYTQLEIAEQSYSEGYEDCRTEAITALDTLCEIVNDSTICFDCVKIEKDVKGDGK